MANNENNPAKPTKEQASQTYKSLEELQNKVQTEDTITASNLSPINTPPDTNRVSYGPDQTVPKTTEPCDTGQATRDTTAVRGDGCQCQERTEIYNRTDGNPEGGHLRDHQCAHSESLIGEEHTLHLPKQVSGERTPIQSIEDDFLRGATSGDTLDRPRSGDGNVLSSSLSSSFSSITLCDTCSAAERSLFCSSSIEFWTRIKASRFKCCERVWEHFNVQLKEQYPQDPALRQGRVIHLLKALLDVNGPLDKVHISKYLRVVKFMGPFRLEGERCVVLQQLEDLVSKSNTKDPRNKKKKVCWFGGPMSRAEAETKLDGKAPGTFLIRMSGTEEEEGNFTLSLMMADSTIEHFRLEGHPEEAIRSDPFSLCLTFRGQTFSSLPDLVNNYLRQEEISDGESDNATRCSTVCPDLPFNQIINGYAK